MEIMDFFYEKISNRVKQKIDDLDLTYSEIYPSDPKQISWIINNHRTKNNRFLVTDAILRSYSTDEKTGNTIAYGLLKRLEFENEIELFWGTDNEINGYIYELFMLLWNKIVLEDNQYNIDSELYLCDYVPYAKYSTYWNILFSKNNKYPAFSYGISEDDIILNIEFARNKALKFLYEKCKSSFKKIFLEFISTIDTLHFINKKFQKSFIEESFIPMLNKFKPDGNSLGLRVKNLIECDLSHCASLIYENNSTRNEYFFKLNRASSTYILALEDIQKSNYDFI